MTNYELIQELARYDGDLEVEINIHKDNFSAEAEVPEDCEEGENITVDFDLDEYTKEISVSEEKEWSTGIRKTRLSAEL